MQSQQSKLFFEDEFEALNLMVSNSQKTPKQLASYLFPHLKPDSAYARLKACFNPEKDERLTFGQIIAAMKFCQCYEPLMFACDETLHGRPARVEPQDEKAELQRQFIQTTKLLSVMADRIEALGKT